MYIFSRRLPSSEIVENDVDGAIVSTACVGGIITNLGIKYVPSFLFSFNIDTRRASPMLMTGQFLVTLPAEHRIAPSSWDDVTPRSSGELTDRTSDDNSSVAVAIAMAMRDVKTWVSVVVALCLFDLDGAEDDGGADDEARYVACLFSGGAMVVDTRD
jgi:hypothetical protein